jgi:hypothetical protein
LPKGLNPYKIQTTFKLEFVLNFIIQNLERFGAVPENKFDPLKFIYQLTKFGDVWNSGRLSFVFSKFEWLESN